MQSSLSSPQVAPQKVKNILIRHSCSKRVEPDSQYQHPETPYLLKYAPKYYKSLTLQATCQNPLLSKVKKIKKLKTFTGRFDRHFPQQYWFNLLGDNRKEIEEPPQISSNNVNLDESFWKRPNQQKLKYFWNVKRIWLSKWKDPDLVHDLDNFLLSKELFIKYVWNLRKLESLKIMITNANYDNAKWILDKFDGMGGLLKRLETLSLDIQTYHRDIQDLFQNKKLFSHLTGLNLSVKFDQFFAEIPQMCKKLNSLALNFQIDVGDRPEFRTFLTKIQQLTQLKSLDFNWSASGGDFWDHFKPQSSLEYLRLGLGDYELINAELFEENMLKEIVEHWEEIKELKILEVNLSCSIPEKFKLLKLLTTEVLKKIQKLETLKILVYILLADDDSQKTYEPFFVEDVSHLYESLERFEYRLCCGYREDLFTKFDLEILVPFKNLSSLKLEGDIKPCRDIEQILSLLERNHKEYPILEFSLKKSIDSPVDWLREALESIEKTKRSDKNLKIMIDLKLGLGGYMETFEELCSVIHSIKTIKGVGFCLNFDDEANYSQFPDDKIWELMRRFAGIRNFHVVFSNAMEKLELIRIDGEREQFFINR